jgi:hypothetical protein
VRETSIQKLFTPEGETLLEAARDDIENARDCALAADPIDLLASDLDDCPDEAADGTGDMKEALPNDTDIFTGTETAFLSLTRVSLTDIAIVIRVLPA